MTMQEYALAGRVVLPESVIENGLVAFSDGKITYVGTCDAYTGNASVEQVGTKLITPGFVDIHCHDAMNILGSDDPETVADYYLKHGTTSMLITLYRDLWPNEVHKATERVRAAMQSCKNIMGIHFEGPYMNPRYGCTVGDAEPVVPMRADYMPFVDSGLVKQWTFAPEMPGTDEFLADICAAGIIPAIGHSEASPEDVQRVCRHGVRIVTHIMDATGTSVTPSRYEGTREVSFDDAVLLENNLFYEVILDKNGIHVRHDLVRLILKTVGVDRVVGITDACRVQPGSIDDEVNLFDGNRVDGSVMAMDNVARNFRNLGLSLPEVFKIVSLNPATALRIEHQIGSLAVGKNADILVMDNDFHIERVYKA